MSLCGAFGVLDSLSPRDLREALAATDKHLDFTTIDNDYTPEVRQIKEKAAAKQGRSYRLMSNNPKLDPVT